MKFFSKKETLIQNITYMAIMAAINVVFVLLSVFLPYLYVLLLFVLPLSSTFVMIFCKKRYFPIYAIATIGLCLLASFNSIGDTIFYIIPSILTGAIAGILIEKSINGVWIVIFTSITQFAFSLITLPLIKAITGVELMNSVYSIMGLNDFQYKNYLTMPLIYFVSLAQMALTFFILKNEIKKIGIEVETNFSKFDIILLSLYEILMFTTMTVSIFVYKELTLISLALGIVPSIFLLGYEISLLKKIRLIIIGVIVIIFPFVFALLYPLCEVPLGFLLLAILFISVNIPTFCRVFQKNLGK